MKKMKFMLLGLGIMSMCCGCGADATAVVPVDGTIHTVEDFGNGAWNGLQGGSAQNDRQEDADGNQQGGGAQDNRQEDDMDSNLQGGGAQDDRQGDDAAGTPASPDPAVTITISAAGDVTLGNHHKQEYGYSFREMYDKEGDAYFLRNVKYLFEADDMTLVNFEGVLTFSEEMQEKEYNMKGDPSYINILTEGSVEAVSFANNHRLDYLEQGSKDTVAAFEEADITYAYDNYLGVYETAGIRIGIVSVNEVSQGAYVEKYLEEGIELLREEEEADLVVACCHWGVERENYPEDYQKKLGRKCIDWGADLVLGAHPHVLQGVEVYEGKFIVYSLANFCFGGNRNPADKDTMIFQQTFTFTDGVKQESMVARVIPCSVSSVSNRNDFCPTPAEGDEYTRILNRINEYSEPFGVEFGEDGFYTGSVQ